jgi:hypothetical protein
MKTRNARKFDRFESEHLSLVKLVACVTCNAQPPGEAHHMEQGRHWTCIAWCVECHRGSQGWHGTKVRQLSAKQTELDCLNETLRRVAMLQAGINYQPTATKQIRQRGGDLSSNKIIPRAA